MAELTCKCNLKHQIAVFEMAETIYPHAFSSEKVEFYENYSLPCRIDTLMFVHYLFLLQGEISYLIIKPGNRCNYYRGSI